MSKYKVALIGGIGGDPFAGQPPLPIPPGWVPAGTPDRAGLPPSPVPTVALAIPASAGGGPELLFMGLGGLALGLLGGWAWQRWVR